MIWRAICRDIFSRQRIYLFAFSLLLVLLLKNSLTYQINLTLTMFSVLLLSLIGSYQLFFSYFREERVQGYYQLPLSTRNFYLQFLSIAFVSNLIERLLLLVLLVGGNNWKNVLLMILYSALVIISSFRLLRILESFQKIATKILTIVYISLILLIVLIWHSVILLCLFLILELILVLRDRQYFYLNEISTKNNLLNLKNYFLTSLLKERYFYINTGVSLLFILLLFFQTIPNSIKFPMLITVASTNTPLTTLISSSPHLDMQLHCLPRVSVLYNMYLKCLLLYYITMNGIVVTLYVLITHNWILLIIVFFYTVFEAIAYLFIEKYFSIKNWKIKKELWKHPRKYIIPVLTYIFFFVVSLVIN